MQNLKNQSLTISLTCLSVQKSILDVLEMSSKCNELLDNNALLIVSSLGGIENVSSCA